MKKEFLKRHRCAKVDFKMDFPNGFPIPGNLGQPVVVV